MTIHCDVDFKDNSGEILAAFKEQVARAMEQIGMLGENGAKEACSVDTGNLRNSITHSVEDDTAYIGTNSKYGAYVEFGTGDHCTLGGGRNTPWRYQDAKGNWHTTTGSPAQPFLKPGVESQAANFQAVVEAELKG